MSKRVLILEDNDLCADILRQRVLKEWPDFTIVHVNNRKDYVNTLTKEDYDIILSDYSLPDFSGMQALFAARELCPEVPFIFVSGAISEDVAMESLKAGAIDYILKDRPARLIPAIKRAFDLAEANGRRIEHTTLINSVDGIVWQADQASLQFLFVSLQAQRILGYPIENWTKEPDFWQKHIHPDDKEMAVNVCRHLTSEKKHSDFEYRMIAADGRTVWLRDMVSVCFIKNRRPQIQGIMVDVTTQKTAGEKIKEVQLKLEETNKDLLRRNQEIKNFYHVLSHELKTPLTSAREFVSMVMDGLAGPLNETQMEYLGIAKESCNQLRLCINDLLDTTRIETGKLSLEFKSINLIEVIRRAARTLQSKATELQIDLSVESPSDVLAIDADEGRIKQIITNLVDNAFKFTASGGRITVEIEEVPGRPDYIQVFVNDTGRGIPKKEQDCIFDRLYQIKNGDAASGQGIGLGLYLCRELVWLHGGIIWVKSEEGKGSTFAFMIPKNQKHTQPDVLIMDDDPVLLETTSLMLANECRVRTAMDGADGLKEIRRKCPDVVIMDLSMPHVDGVEVLKEIREKWDLLPVIVHTAHPNSEIMARAMKYSPFTLLSKPSGMDALLRAVRHLNLVAKKDTGGEFESRILEKSYVIKTEPLPFEIQVNGHGSSSPAEEVTAS